MLPLFNCVIGLVNYTIGKGFLARKCLQMHTLATAYIGSCTACPHFPYLIIYIGIWLSTIYRRTHSYLILQSAGTEFDYLAKHCSIHNTHTHLCAYMHTHTHTYAFTYTPHTFMYTNTDTHTHTHTHTQPNTTALIIVILRL